MPADNNADNKKLMGGDRPTGAVFPETGWGSWARCLDCVETRSAVGLKSVANSALVNRIRLFSLDLTALFVNGIFDHNVAMVTVPSDVISQPPNLSQRHAQHQTNTMTLVIVW